MTRSAYEHRRSRSNNPTAETAKTSHPQRRAPKRHRLKEDDHTKIPTLAWKRESEGKTVSAPLLATVEKIDPAAWIESLCHKPHQQDAFEGFDRYEHPDRARWEWYEHRGAWQNRLIHADAKRAMASLLENEHMAGEVQCIYFDPPYGMDFDASFMDDTVQVTAFRDSYERGIHAYLDGIRETTRLACELLNESGSFFMQIGDVNVHRCAMVLDEVFGPENRVAMITFATTGGGSSTKNIPKSGDYILWYAKNRDTMFFQQLYEEQDIEGWCDQHTFAAGGDFPNGEVRALKHEERRDPKNNLPEETKLWAMNPILSQGPSRGEQGQPFTYNGTQFGPKGLDKNQWAVDQKGLQHLASSGRLWTNVEKGTPEARANQLRMKLYRNEMPGRRINTIWASPIKPSDKRYTVQTGNLAIQRCLLMTSRPGDLVLDPTIGGGTTALVAETWGRRWIGIDSSRNAIAITRERILVHNYPMHHVLGSPEGFKEENHRRQAAEQTILAEKPDGELDPSTGFVYERIPYVSAATLAYEKRPDKKRGRDIIYLVDRTYCRAHGRICSRFTVEADLTEIYLDPEEILRPTQARRDARWQERAIDALDRGGIRSDSDQEWDLEGLQNLLDDDSVSATGFPGALTHRGTLIDRKTGKKKTAVIAIWPEDAKVDENAIHHNIQAARGKAEVLIVVGAEFADGTEPPRSGQRWAMEVMRVKPSPELHLKGVTDKAKTAQITLVAEPALRVEKEDDGQFTCEIYGWNEFNPVTGVTHWREAKEARAWMLDTNYDGTQFCARRIHFPARIRRAENYKCLKRLLGRDGSPERLNAAFGWKSHPFGEPASGQIAVRIITAGGGTMSWSGRISDALVQSGANQKKERANLASP